MMALLRKCLILAIACLLICHNVEGFKLKKSLKKGLLIYGLVQALGKKDSPSSMMMMPMPMAMPMPMMMMPSPTKKPCDDTTLLDLSHLHDLEHDFDHHHDIHFDFELEARKMKMMNGMKPMMSMGGMGKGMGGMDMMMKDMPMDMPMMKPDMMAPPMGHEVEMTPTDMPMTVTMDRPEPEMEAPSTMTPMGEAMNTETPSMPPPTRYTNANRASPLRIRGHRRVSRPQPQGPMARNL